MSHTPALVIRKAQARDADAIAAFNSAMALETEGRALLPQRIAAGVRHLLADPAPGLRVGNAQPCAPRYCPERRAKWLLLPTCGTATRRSLQSLTLQAPIRLSQRRGPDWSRSLRQSVRPRLSLVLSAALFHVICTSSR